LIKYNINVTTVESGFECIDNLKTNNYDLILIDDMMPKMTGSETLMKLKENSKFNTPIVVLTANAISGMKEKYIKDGFNDYLAKPINQAELNRVLNKFLGGK